MELSAEDQSWADAYRIAYVGASNPAAAAGSLGKNSAAITREVGTANARRHPALRAIASHVAYLFGYGLGPDIELLDQIEANAKRLGILPCPDYGPDNPAEYGDTPADR